MLDYAFVKFCKYQFFAKKYDNAELKIKVIHVNQKNVIIREMSIIIGCQFAVGFKRNYNNLSHMEIHNLLL